MAFFKEPRCQLANAEVLGPYTNTQGLSACLYPGVILKEEHGRGDRLGKTVRKDGAFQSIHLNWRGGEWERAFFGFIA